jgi:hypothetical protein
VRRALAGVALVTACGLSAWLGAYAGSHDSPPEPATVTVPSWADGCATDLECAGVPVTGDTSGLYGGIDEAYQLADCIADADCPMPDGWEWVSPEIGDALAEGDDTPPEHAASRDWESCWWHVGDTSVIVCPDGYVTTS